MKFTSVILALFAVVTMVQAAPLMVNTEAEASAGGPVPGPKVPGNLNAELSADFSEDDFNQFVSAFGGQGGGSGPYPAYLIPSPSPTIRAHIITINHRSWFSYLATH